MTASLMSLRFVSIFLCPYDQSGGQRPKSPVNVTSLLEWQRSRICPVPGFGAMLTNRLETVHRTVFQSHTDKWLFYSIVVSVSNSKESSVNRCFTPCIGIRDNLHLGCVLNLVFTSTFPNVAYSIPSLLPQLQLVVGGVVLLYIQ